jgi:MFS family permease
LQVNELSMPTPPYRRNFAALLGDAIAFGLAITFADTTTILPDLVRKLTDNPAIVGLFSAVTSGAWLLPQLVYARFLTSKKRKKPFVILGAAIGRPFYLLYAAALWFGLRDPVLALVLLFVAQVVFNGSDSMASVAWFDLYAKAIPENRRGRLVGIAQAVRGVLAFGAGALITALLSARTIPFPQNYGPIFALSGACLLLSLLALGLVKEPDEPAEAERPSWGNYLPRLWATLRQDHAFRRLILIRLLAGCDALALSFYIVFATEKLGLPQEIVGVFTVVKTVGGIAASLLLGVISERLGNHRVLQLATATSLTAPLLGLGFYLGGAQASAVTTVIYGWVYVVIAIGLSAIMFGFFNYALEMAPASQRPTYMGLFNTSTGALAVVPLLGGLLLKATSYGVLFGVTAAILAVAHGLTWSLRPRRAITAPPGPATAAARPDLPGAEPPPPAAPSPGQ